MFSTSLARITLMQYDNVSEGLGVNTEADCLRFHLRPGNFSR
jgi:hypothetical protein